MFNELIKRLISSLILLPLVFFIVIKGSPYFNFFLLACFLMTIFEWNKLVSKKIFYYAGLFFLVLSFLSVYKIRYSFDNEYDIFLLISGICISTDVGGFIFGKLLKGPKLTKISPNKTISGMFGSFLSAFIFINFFFKYFNAPNIQILSIQIIFFSIIVSFISQLGDICISHFKRSSNIKDTGNLIPGHGGILDRIDGMIFAFPFSYLIITSNLFNII